MVATSAYCTLVLTCAHFSVIKRRFATGVTPPRHMHAVRQRRKRRTKRFAVNRGPDAIATGMSRRTRSCTGRKRPIDQHPLLFTAGFRELSFSSMARTLVPSTYCAGTQTLICRENVSGGVKSEPVKIMLCAEVNVKLAVKPG
jgi:hypothetical protein